MESKNPPGTKQEFPPTGTGDPTAAAFDRRIARNIAGSFIISVATIPFGYLITLILARVSPEAVGTYSLLGIYLGVISSVLYFGGGTVTIHFMAELSRGKRLPFFVSYYALSLVVTGLTAVLLILVPALASFLFGSRADIGLPLLLLVCAPLPLFYFASLATLRGLMAVTVAQTLMRSLTIGACLVYGYVVLFHRDVFEREYTKIVIIPYFAILLILSILAFRRVLREMGATVSGLAFYLPPGFWSFALAVQAASMLALMHRKIDQIVLVWALGLSQLGIYFVLVQLAEASVLLNMFFLDGVFPAMVNLRVRQRFDKIAELYQSTARHLLLISSSMTFLIIALAGPVLSIFGSQYAASRDALLLFLLFTSIDSLGPLNHNLLIGMKEVNTWVVIQFIRVSTFLSLFALWGDRYGLVGIVAARGLAWCLAGALAYWVVLRKMPTKLRIPRQFFLHVGISVTLVLLGYLRPETGWAWIWGIVLYLVALAAFLVFGGYKFSEFKQLRSLWRGEGRTGPPEGQV